LFLLGVFICVGRSAFAADQYGAISIAPDTGALGYSYDFPSQQAAENDALRRCQVYGASCKTAIWFRNACGAVALSTSGNGHGSGWANNPGKA
jgi:serine/threonine-protein kinase